MRIGWWTTLFLRSNDANHSVDSAIQYKIGYIIFIHAGREIIYIIHQSMKITANDSINCIIIIHFLNI